MPPRLPGLLATLLLLAGTAARAQVEPEAQRARSADASWSDVFAPPAPPALPDSDWTQLEAGLVLVHPLPPSDGEGVAVLAIGLVDAPPAPVWQVLADCEEQDEFVPRVALAVVRDRDGDSHTCELVLDMPFPLEDLRAVSRHHVRRLPDGGYQRRWQLLPGDSSYHRNGGSWSVHPHAGGRSLLVNRMDMLPRSALPVWLLEAAQSRQAPATFEAIRARVRAVAASRE